jgi:hypothetical protein
MAQGVGFGGNVVKPSDYTQRRKGGVLLTGNFLGCGVSGIVGRQSGN